jgi:putative spermidine/putrescine transport system substrate-binding protein
MKKRSLCAALLALAIATPAGAEELIVGSWGGVWDDTVKANIIDPLVAETGATASIVPGTSTEQFARLLANRGNPPVDVLFLDLDVAVAGFAQGMFEPITVEKVPNLANAFPASIYGDGTAVAHSFGAVTIVYDSAKVRDVDSWRILEDPKWSGQFSISPFDTWGAYVLSALGAVEGSGPDDFDAGWKALGEIAPRALLLGRDSEMRSLFERGEVAFATMYSGEAYVMSTGGLPGIRMAKPKEGMIAVPNLLVIPKGAKHLDLAYAFIDKALSVPAQTAFANEYASAPSVKGVDLAPELLASMPATAEDFDRLIKPDWMALNAQKDAMLQRWNTEIVPVVGTE